MGPEVWQLPLASPGWIFALLMAVVLFAPILAERVRIPGVVGLVLAGVLIGPHTTGLLQREGAIALLGSVGLLYLMFLVGLELDLDDFLRARRQALLFGVLTFAFPMLLGTLLIPLMGFDLLAAVLLASCWASHTLVAYPVFRRFGTASSRAVAVSVGATIVTDTAALLVLAVVARAHTGGLDTRFWVTLVPSLGLLALALLVGLPRLARWFLGQLGQDRSARFLFLLVALFAAAGLAEVAGVEAIVGAFLAGLALNRVVASGSILMERVEFFGSTFLVPLFLVSVGMLVDPAVLVDPATLALSAGFTAIALGGKWLAAFTAGKALRYGKVEIGAMFSLSGAQAAATLAAVVVGLEIGLLDELTVNAVIGVILVTCLLTSWTGARYAPRLPPPERRQVLGRTVVVPIARPESAGPLLRLAAGIARRDGGVVLPLVVVPGGAAAGLAAGRDLAAQAEGAVLALGGEAAAIVRIDDSVAAGAVHTLAERDGSFMVVGWKGYSTRRESLFGGIIDAIVADSHVPLVVGRLHDRPWRRIVLLVAESNVTAAERSSLELAMEVTARVAADAAIPVTVVSASDRPLVSALAAARLKVEVVHDPRRRALVASLLAGRDDLVVLPLAPDGAELSREAAGVAQAVPGTSVIAVLDSAARRIGTVHPPAGEALEEP